MDKIKVGSETLPVELTARWLAQAGHSDSGRPFHDAIIVITAIAIITMMASWSGFQPFQHKYLSKQPCLASTCVKLRPFPLHFEALAAHPDLINPAPQILCFQNSCRHHSVTQWVSMLTVIPQDTRLSSTKLVFQILLQKCLSGRETLRLEPIHVQESRWVPEQPFKFVVILLFL